MQSLSRSTECMIRQWIYEEERRMEASFRKVQTLRVTRPAAQASSREFENSESRKAA